MLSTATAKWKKLNAREELHNFTDLINKINDYKFEKDFVLKGSLFLTKGLPIKYQIKNFTKKNLEKIEDNWDKIKENIENSVLLVSKMGFINKNITSSVALLPVALYLAKINKSNFVNSTEIEDVKIQNRIQKWLLLVFLKNAFSSATDKKLQIIQKIIENNTSNDFPIEEINTKLEIQSEFSDNEIERLLKTKYRTRYSFSILSLLYPDRDWKDNNYHEDHIFPKSEFHKRKLRKRGYDENTVDDYINYFDTVANIELLTESENLSKSNTDFNKWINTRDENFKRRHSIPEMENYNFDTFIEFIEKRKLVIKEKLLSIKI